MSEGLACRRDPPNTGQAEGLRRRSHRRPCCSRGTCLMLPTPWIPGGAGRWVVVLAAVALVLEGATLPATASFVEETTAHALAEQEREFTLLPQISSGGWLPVPWLMDQREQNHFALAALDEPEDAAPTGPDWVGLARDTGLLIGYQAVAIGVLFLLPEDVSHW